MHCTEPYATRTRMLQPLAAAVLGVAGLFLLPAANAQMNQTQPRPQAQSPQAQPPRAQSPSPTISDQKLTAAAAALGQVTNIRQSYERKIAEAPQPDKQRVTDEANNALKKAVTDQGLSVDEYNTILQTAQNDPTIRQKLAQRVPPAAH
jgi:predicted secreted protein